MTALIVIAVWFGLGMVAAPLVGRKLAAASAQTSTHWCGGTLLFVREAGGHSYEQCSGCEFAYDFDKSRVSDASALVGWTR